MAPAVICASAPVADMQDVDTARVLPLLLLCHAFAAALMPHIERAIRCFFMLTRYAPCLRYAPLIAAMLPLIRALFDFHF